MKDGSPLHSITLSWRATPATQAWAPTQSSRHPSHWVNTGDGLGGRQKDVDKTLQGPPHWNTLVQWRSALSLQYYTNTADQKYQLLFVVDFINIHNHACLVNWKSFLLVLHHFYLSCKKLLSLHLWCFTFLWKYKLKSRWGVWGMPTTLSPGSIFINQSIKKHQVFSNLLCCLCRALELLLIAGSIGETRLETVKPATFNY